MRGRARGERRRNVALREARGELARTHRDRSPRAPRGVPVPAPPPLERNARLWPRCRSARGGCARASATRVREPASAEQHGDLCLCVGDVVQGLDLLPKAAHLEDLARHGVGTRQLRRAGAASPRRAERRRSTPARSTKSLVTWVVMISRRRRWRLSCAPNAGQRRREVARAARARDRGPPAGRSRSARRASRS